MYATHGPYIYNIFGSIHIFIHLYIYGMCPRGDPPPPQNCWLWFLFDPFWVRGTLSYILVSNSPNFHFGKWLAVRDMTTCWVPCRPSYYSWLLTNAYQRMQHCNQEAKPLQGFWGAALQPGSIHNYSFHDRRDDTPHPQSQYINNRKINKFTKSPSSRAGMPVVLFLMYMAVIKKQKSPLEMAIRPKL